MQKLAVIDCGTNTFHLLIASVNGTGISTEFKWQIPIKLGEGGINQKTIAPAAYQRGISALVNFSEKIKELQISRVAAFATSAIRSAENGELFVAEVKERTGIELTPISGQREAELIYKGVQHAYPMGNENILAMDIGGGSVEFIIGNAHAIQWYGSFEIGAARLVEKFHRTEPIDPNDLTALYNYLKQVLTPLFQALQQFPVTKLVGSAGSFDSICELVNENFNRHLLQNNETWCQINLDDYQAVHQMLVASTLEDRKQMAGLIDYRIEMIVVASCLINFVLQQSGIPQLYCATYSLKEGIMFEMLEK